MSFTNFRNGVSSFGIPQVGAAPLNYGPYVFVRFGNRAFGTVQAAIDSASPGTTILIAPGTYVESLAISRPTTNNGSRGLILMGMGTPGSVTIAPTGTNVGAITNNADDVTFINVNAVSTGTGVALTNTGARVGYYNSRLYNGAGTGVCAGMRMGTAAQVTAGTAGNGSGCLLEGCEFGPANNGVVMTCTDNGALSTLTVRGSRFRALAASSIAEVVSGGTAANTYRQLLVDDCVFERLTAGTEPTNYILINGNNANSGVITRSAFPTATAGGKNLVSTAVIWTGNLLSGGISAAQPS